jgi:hypothetical protein
MKGILAQKKTPELDMRKKHFKKRIKLKNIYIFPWLAHLSNLS